jgi:tetratricopeptide (TPR) repeat protein
VKANPPLAWLYNNWGVDLQNNNLDHQALEKYSRSLALNPGDSQVRYNYAIALEDNSDYSGALEQLSILARFHHEFHAAISELQRLRKHR